MIRNLFLLLIASSILVTRLFAQDSAEDTQWLTELAGNARLEAWQKRSAKIPTITAEALDQAIEGARFYILAQQSPRGNFRYSMDFTEANFQEDSDNAVRQAGTLWSICNLNRDRFNEPTRQACLLGLDFFMH